MGCLKNILRAIILTLAVVGFMALGGKELVSGLINNYFNPPKDTMLERAQKVGDFSKINDEFEIERAAGIMGYNAVVAEHKASGQKMFVVDSGDKDILTAEDIKSENVEEKLYKAISKIKYQAVSVEDLKVTKHGTMHSYGKEVPYVKFEARIKNHKKRGMHRCDTLRLHNQRRKRTGSGSLQPGVQWGFCSCWEFSFSAIWDIFRKFQ